MNDHELIEELVAVRSLGGLEPAGLEELRLAMAAHGLDCAECRRLEAEYDEVAGRLAFSLEPVPVRDGFEDEVVALATREPAAATPRVDGRRSRHALRALVAVAASLILFVGGWAVGNLTSDGDGVPARARVVAFEGTGGNLSVAYRPGERGVYLLGSDLDQPPEGTVYEVWMIQGETPVPGPCLVPQADGSLFAYVDAEIGTTHTMAVTVEPSACSTAPTTDPILTAAIA